jgi:hypothetical protein
MGLKQGMIPHSSTFSTTGSKQKIINKKYVTKQKNSKKKIVTERFEIKEYRQEIQNKRFKRKIIRKNFK